MSTKMFKAARFTQPLTEERARMTTLFKAVLAGESPLCDVKIKVVNECGESVLIGACKHRLMEQSDFFMELFTATSVHRCEELSLHGVSEDAIRTMIGISFGRYDDIAINEDNIAQYMFASHKYLCTLLYRCCDYVIESWQSKIHEHIHEYLTMCSNLYHIGMTHKYDELLNTIDLFKDTSLLKRAFKSSALLTLPMETMIEMVKSDYLNIDEHDIWVRCIEWCHINGECIQSDGIMEKESKQQQHLDDEDDEPITKLDLLLKLKPFIRFPLMDEYDIERLSRLPDLFTDEEVSNYLSIKQLNHSDDAGSIQLNPRIEYFHGFDLFKVGSQVDCRDFSCYWYSATVKQVKQPGEACPPIGFAKSRLCADKETSAVLVGFDGWPETNDEWLLRDGSIVCSCEGRCRNRNHRIAKLGAQTI